MVAAFVPATQTTRAKLANEVACGKYSPEAHGARCDRCFLWKQRQGGPVPPEVNQNASLMVAAEAPGPDEVQFNRPLIGQSGQEIMQGLATIGVNRSDVNWTNAFLCRPPNNDLDRLLRRMKKENKAREAAGLEPYLSPMEACHPRFVEELRLQQDVIALGKIGAQSITGTNRSIFDLRGMPLDGILAGDGRFHTTAYFAASPNEFITKLRVVPTVHPAFVLRQKRWRKPFRVDLARAIRWFRGTLQWKEPQKLFIPTPQQLEDFILRAKHPFVVSDVETDAKEPLIAKLRCIGFSTTEFGMVVPLLSIDGHTHFYDSATEQAIIDIMVAHYRDPRILKVGHNFGYYDRIVIRRQLGADPDPIVDTILLHRGVESELPHNLGFVGSLYTDVMDAWKADHTATQAKSDQDLWDYNLTDCVVDARVTEPLYSVVVGRGLTRSVDVHHKIQKFCADLHSVGMYVDQYRRRQHDEKFRKEAAEQRQLLRNIIGNPEFNPNSRDQVASILFDKWGLHPEVIYENDPSAAKKIKKAYTKDGAPSTGDDNLRAMMLYVQKEEQKLFLRGMRKFRGAVKLRGTNVIPLRPFDEPYFAQDDLQINADTEEGLRALDEEDAADLLLKMEDLKGPKRKKLKEKKPGLVLADMRMHSHFNAHAATSQRLTSSEPNAQNFSRKIRDMICAQMDIPGGVRSLDDYMKLMARISAKTPGRVLIGADEDQLELRFATALSKAARYLEVFYTGGDPHYVTCELLYGNLFKNASESDQKRLRDFAKRFSYAVIYRASVETVFETLASSENDAGDLVFPWLTLKETRVFYDKWIGGVPEIPQWWDRDLAEYRQQGYLIEPVLGWRRDFLDGEDENELANFKCQAGGAAIVHLGTIEFLKHVPFERWGPGTGVIQQGHDALVVEAPAVHPPHSLKKNKDGSLDLDKFGLPKIDKWCPKGCKCVTEETRQTLQSCLTVDGNPYGLPLRFTAGAKVGFRWNEV